MIGWTRRKIFRGNNRLKEPSNLYGLIIPDRDRGINKAMLESVTVFHYGNIRLKAKAEMSCKLYMVRRVN